MQTTTNVIDKNWKALIKPNKLEITSNDDRTVAKVIAEPRKRIWTNNWKLIKKNFTFLNTRCRCNCFTN